MEDDEVGGTSSEHERRHRERAVRDASRTGQPEIGESPFPRSVVEDDVVTEDTVHGKPVAGRTERDDMEKQPLAESYRIGRSVAQWVPARCGGVSDDATSDLHGRGRRQPRENPRWLGSSQ